MKRQIVSPPIFYVYYLNKAMNWNVLHLDNGCFRAFKIVNVPETLKTEIMKIKIKTKDGIVDATAEVIDGDMIVSPKVEKFEPKDGDVVFVKGALEHILIYKEEKSENIVAYADLVDSILGNVSSHAICKANVVDLRPATEDEKQKLFDKLKEKGFEWDAEKKEVVKIKWKPIRGASYYKPGIRGAEIRVVSDSWAEDVFDKSYYDKGWVFKTYEECEAFCNKLRQAIEGVKP